jgi:hypothetical protein
VTKSPCTGWTEYLFFASNSADLKRIHRALFNSNPKLLNSVTDLNIPSLKQSLYVSFLIVAVLLLKKVLPKKALSSRWPSDLDLTKRGLQNTGDL